MAATVDSLRAQMIGKFDEVFDHDGDGQADSKTVAEALEYANALLFGLVHQKGFPSSSSVHSLLGDPVMVTAANWLAADYGATLKPALVDAETGKTVYDAVKNRALEAANQVASHRLRLASEGAAGRPSNVRSLRGDIDPDFYFAPSGNSRRGPGGF